MQMVLPILASTLSSVSANLISKPINLERTYQYKSTVTFNYNEIISRLIYYNRLI